MNPERVYPACPYPALPPPIEIPLTVLPTHPCPYLPGRMAQSRAFAAGNLSAELYHDLMDAGFRRAGELFYQPICRGCRACMAIRIPVTRFTPSKSQRRCRRRNSDLDIAVGRPAASDEKFELYGRYLAARHRGPMLDDDREQFEAFLCRSPVDSVEVCYRERSGRLLAAGVCDVCPRSLSSVYYYFDPDQRQRSLGTFGSLVEIELCARLGIAYYYLGYWVLGCRAMEYKASFRPCEILHADGIWRELPPADRPQRRNTST